MAPRALSDSFASWAGHAAEGVFYGEAWRAVWGARHVFPRQQGAELSLRHFPVSDG
jgi:hypothetical protein